MSGYRVVVMGVAGCGKSAMGSRLALLLGLPLVEGDDFHPPDNIRKMQQGVPLDDQDRAGWLAQLAAELAARPDGAVLTCSALKRAYRDVLRRSAPGLCFVHLALTPEQSAARVAGRDDHFYPSSLVASQFAALENPAAEPRVLSVDAMESIEALAVQAANWLRTLG